MTPPQPATAFVTTRWTQVLKAKGDTPEARDALAVLCESYWTPVFRYIQREGRDEETSRDLTQEFFARLLAGNGIGAVEQGRGRFRSYLLGSVKHFLADQRDRALAARRGGELHHTSIDAKNDTSETGRPWLESSSPPPDSFFDRQWALHLIDRTLKTLSDEFASAGKTGQFEILKGWLIGDAAGVSQADAARQLGLTEGAIKVVVHRLRKRYRELVKAELAQTVETPDEIQMELNYLLEALAHE